MLEQKEIAYLKHVYRMMRKLRVRIDKTAEVYQDLMTRSDIAMESGKPNLAMHLEPLEAFGVMFKDFNGAIKYCQDMINKSLEVN